MTMRNKIELARERRLWITNVILPIGLIGAYIYNTNDNVKAKVKTTTAKIKDIFKND